MLDASAILAYLLAEPGGQRIGEELSDAVVAAPNWSELALHAQRRGVPWPPVAARLVAHGLRIEAMTSTDAEAAARLGVAHAALGLSLGDRACLALAQRLDAAAVTADRSWVRVKGAKVVLLRTRS